MKVNTGTKKPGFLGFAEKGKLQEIQSPTEAWQRTPSAEESANYNALYHAGSVVVLLGGALLLVNRKVQLLRRRGNGGWVLRPGTGPLGWQVVTVQGCLVYKLRHKGVGVVCQAHMRGQARQGIRTEAKLIPPQQWSLSLRLALRPSAGPELFETRSWPHCTLLHEGSKRTSALQTRAYSKSYHMKSVRGPKQGLYFRAHKTAKKLTRAGVTNEY